MEKKNLGYQRYIHDCEKKLASIEKEKAAYEESAKDVLSHVEKLATERKEIEKEHKEKVKIFRH